MKSAALALNAGAADCCTAARMWDHICTAILGYRRLFLFVDFDGAFSQIADDGFDGFPDVRTREAVRRVCNNRLVSIVLLSSRSVNDLSERVGLPLIYGGDHGLEIHGPDFHFVVPEASSGRLILPELCNRIADAIGDIPGALVESRRLTAIVHHNHVAPDLRPDLQEIIRECVDCSEFELRTSDGGVEIRPRVEWSKGDAATWILHHNAAVPEQSVCIGEADGDDDMFLRAPAGIHVRVVHRGSRKPSDGCYVRREDMARFLHGIADVAEGIC